jgi:hypothetical protein
MRQRTRNRLILLGFVLTYAAAFVAMAASKRVGPRWLGLTLAAIGWTVFALFNIVNVLAMWRLMSRPVANSPWILGGPPNPSPSQDSDKRIA